MVTVVAPVVVLAFFLLLCLGLLAESVAFVLDYRARHRAEAAYWDAKASRPRLYDWEVDGDA